MDRIRKFDRFGYDILDDPYLKTSAGDFPFKYIAKEQFEQVIKMVHRDRMKQKKASIWTEIKSQPPTTSVEQVMSAQGKKLNKNNRKNIIKTPKSTVKILTHSTVDKRSDTQESPRLKNEYVVPRIRIMTDDEIQKVVENAVKEVIDKREDGHVVTARRSRWHSTHSPNLDLEAVFSNAKKNEHSVVNTQRAKSPKPKDTVKQRTDIIKYEYEEPHKEYQRNDGYDAEIEDNSEIISNPNTPKKQNTPDNCTPRWIKVGDAGDGNMLNLAEEITPPCEEAAVEDYEHSDNTPRIVQQTSEKSVSVYDLPTYSAQSVSVRSNKGTQVGKEDIRPKEPTLSSVERGELRTLLGVKEIIESPKIDVDNVEVKSSSEEDIDEEKEEEIRKNIYPVIHIRKPVPLLPESSEEEDISMPPTAREDDKTSSSDTEYGTPRVPDAQEENVFTRESSRNATPIASPTKKSLPLARRMEIPLLSNRSSVATPRVKTGLKSSRSPKTPRKPPRDPSPNKPPTLKEDDETSCSDTESDIPSVPEDNICTIESSRNDTPTASPTKKSLPSARRLEIPLPSNRSSVTTPRVQTGLKSSRSPKTPQKPPRDPSPNKPNEMNEEKLTIFSKITSYQEKIISLLDQLRLNLVNLSLPDGQPDRKRRENLVLEFTARFGRNYLYQLDRMVREIQLISKEQYLSNRSNEGRTKICVVYGILYQATQSYIKQVKYFLVDQNPRKLDVLIGFITTVTNICISKNVFDKNDKIISCLLDRCDSMLEFLADINQQRKAGLATQKSKKEVNIKVLKIQSKWVIPAINKLAMYEPRDPTSIGPRKRKMVKRKKATDVEPKGEVVVRDKPAPITKPGPIAKPAPITKPVPIVQISSNNETSINKIVIVENGEVKQTPNATNQISNVERLDSMPEIQEKEIITQMEKITMESSTALSPLGSMSNEDLNFEFFESTRTFTDASNRESDDESDLKARVFEALQLITKQQVHQMLEPLVCNLGCILNEKTSALDLETLLNGLNSGNSQVVKATPTGSGTFNRKDDTAYNCDDGKPLRSEHAVSSEHRLDLSQSKQRARALLNRRLSLPSGEDGDVVVTSDRTVELPATHRMELPLPTIEEELTRPNSTLALKGEGGADNIPSLTSIAGQKVQQLRYDKNIQFTFVSAEDEYAVPEGQEIVNMEFNLPLDSDQEVLEAETSAKYGTPAIVGASDGHQGPKLPKEEPDIKYLDGILADRLNFIQQIADNPLYVNEFFAQPWKIVTSLTNKIVNEAIDEVEKEISFGEASYLEDFLKIEMDL